MDVYFRRRQPPLAARSFADATLASSQEHALKHRFKYQSAAPVHLRLERSRVFFYDPLIADDVILFVPIEEPGAVFFVIDPAEAVIGPAAMMDLVVVLRRGLREIVIQLNDVGGVMAMVRAGDRIEFCVHIDRIGRIRG